MANGQANTVPLDATLKLTVLGGASLSYLLPNQEATQVLGPGKPLALLAYLAHLPNRTATRDHVLDLLWSNQDPSMAKPALRQAIWYIRQRIGNCGIESGDGMIKLAVPIDMDSDRFETAVDEGDLERAVGLYGGPFLPDLAIPGGAEFEHWADAERTRLESLFIRTAEVVTRSRLSQGQFQKAEKLARTIRDMNRVRQAWWRLLLEVLTSSGDAVRATVEAGELERTLAANGLEPDRATAEAIRLARQMPATAAQPASGRALVAELVGRERDFATIVRAWDEAKTGSGRHLTVTAGAGFGKTRLLTDVHMRLHASGIQIVHLRANVGERQIGYALASNLAVALSQLPGAKGIPPACAATLVALNPTLSSLYDVAAQSIKDSDLLRIRTIALCELLAAVAHEQPIAVLIDDLHWIDEASHQVLGGFAGCLQNNPALLVVASRTTTRGPLQDSAQTEITLHPLFFEHVLALVSSIGTLPDEEWVRPALRSLRDDNGGSPLLVLESLQLALDRGSLLLRDGNWSCSDGNRLVSEFEQGGALRQRVAKLDRSESWVLLILAVAGMPLSLNQLARMTGRSEHSLSPAVLALEQRGFVARVGDELEPAHDEIGALAVELAASETGPAASGAVGRVLAELKSDNDQMLLRAGQLLAEAGDRGRLNEVFRKRLWLARSRGDRRRARDLASELLGNRSSEAELRTLMGGLPLHCRIGLTSVRRIAATAAVILLVSIAGVTAALWPAGTSPEYFLVAYDHTRGTEGRPVGAALRHEHWATVDGVELTKHIAAPNIPDVHGVPIPSPDGTTWAFAREMPDSGEIDVFIVDGDGVEKRITHTPNDDHPWDWSPDGKQLLIVSSRWHPEEVYEAAVVDVATQRVSRLTTSPFHEGGPRWSPDGTRIGYTRHMLGESHMEFCWTTPIAAATVCVGTVTAFLAWVGNTEVLVGADSAGTRLLGRLNLSTQSFQTLATVDDYERLSSSRDGSWVGGIHRDSVAGESSWQIFPVEAPNQAKRLVFADGRGENHCIIFQTPEPADTYLDHLQIEARSATLAVDIPQLMQASGLDAGRSRIPLHELEWSGDDPSVASVGSNGVIRPRALGDVVVRVSAGGWRDDSVRLVVGPPWHETVFAETWSENFQDNWRLFGNPRPVVTEGPDAIVGFWNNGDRSRTSGAYSVAELPVGEGLGIEASISALITAPHQQKLSLALVGWIDSLAVAGWDHQTGHLPGRGVLGETRSCIVLYPDQETVRAGEIRLIVGEVSEPVNASFPVDRGEWHTVRLQIFPDGTCGVAINGRAIGRSTARVPLDASYRIWTEGVSIGSKMLVGPLEMWIGVKTDVDWGELPWPH